MAAQVETPADVFFFGRPNGQLFGVLHPAETYAMREYGIVVCYPSGQEYIRSHRACRHLALRLAEVGFPVLRFDYRGTGDSAGEATSADMSTWRDDIAIAIDELRERTGVESICLAGLRLGATLAQQVAAESPDVSALILWEPIVDGAAYLDELADQHQQSLWRFFNDPDRLTASMAGEYLGFPVVSTLRSDLEGLNLLACPPRDVDEALIVELEPTAGVARLRDLLSSAGVDVSYQHIPSFATWQEDVDKGLVPDPVLRGIVSWAEEVLP